jgi:hypothetical protein
LGGSILVADCGSKKIAVDITLAISALRGIKDESLEAR